MSSYMGVADLSPLSLGSLRELVEGASPFLSLRVDADAAGKGRFLVAKEPLRRGDVVLEELPLFSGSATGSRSRKAFVEEFFVSAEGTHPEEFEGSFSQDSSVLDCVADVILDRRAALCPGRRRSDQEEAERALLRLRKFSSLQRLACNSDEVEEGLAEKIAGILRPEHRETTGPQNVQDILLALTCNRFGLADSSLDVMFVGSLFEHSCLPNVFISNWEPSSTMPLLRRRYRMLRDVAAGDELSLDYLMLPQGYLPTSGRQEVLRGWGFSCACPRCTSLPEVTRAFICASCGEPELCPPWPDAEELICRKCGQAPSQDYADRCRSSEGEEVSEDENSPISTFHFAAFEMAWSIVANGPAEVDGPEVLHAAVQVLIDSISRLYDDPEHPQLLHFYHTLAQLTEDDRGIQMQWLRLESGVILKNYPEVAERNDSEIMSMVQGRGPHKRNYEDDDAAEVPEAMPVQPAELTGLAGDLSEMD